jgi:hypothetical protein
VLVVLWVRSYWRLIGVHEMVGGRVVMIETERGESTLYVLKEPFGSAVSASWFSMPIELDTVNHQNVPRTTRGGLGFWWWTYGYGFGGRAMLCDVIAIAIIFAGLPWLRRPTWHFSLRTLLIATTLVAVELGLIVWAVK